MLGTPFGLQLPYPDCQPSAPKCRIQLAQPPFMPHVLNDVQGLDSRSAKDKLLSKPPLQKKASQYAKPTRLKVLSMGAGSCQLHQQQEAAAAAKLPGSSSSSREK